MVVEFDALNGGVIVGKAQSAVGLVGHRNLNATIFCHGKVNAHGRTISARKKFVCQQIHFVINLALSPLNAKKMLLSVKFNGGGQPQTCYNMSKIKLINSLGRKACGFPSIALIVFACLAFVCASCQTVKTGPQTFVGIHGKLNVKGTKIVDKNGDPVTLHGMSLYCWATQGTQFFNASAINHFAQDWKCTVIRIAILPSAYKRNPTNEINKVKTVMDACIANGIYAIIDWHAMDGAQNDIPSSQAFFSTLATDYGKTPNIMYEPWNEPVQESWPVIKAYHEAIISKIRAIDPDSIIICGSRHWDQECAEASDESHHHFKEHRLLDPFLRGDPPAVAAQQRGGGAEKRRRPFSTEYGTSSASGGGAYDPEETQLWWTWLDENNIGCCQLVGRGLGRNVRRLQARRKRNGSMDR